MTAVTYTSDLTDITMMEGVGSISDYGGGGGAASAGVDYAIEGTNAVDKQINNTERGFLFDNVSNFSIGADDHFYGWIVMGTYGLADTRNNRGIVFNIGDDTSNFVKFHVNGGDTLPLGGMIPYAIRFVNTTLTNFRTLVGSPSTTPSQIGCGANTTGAAKFANLAMDAVRIGTGYDILNGTGADPEGNFAGIAADDITAREGVLVEIGGGYNLQGKLRIGSASTACEFLDLNTNIIIVDTRHSLTDFTEILVENASSILTLTNVNFNALGTNNPGRLEMLTATATATLVNVGFIDFGASIFGSNSTLTGCRWINAALVTTGNGTFTTCSFDSSPAASAVLAATPAEAAKITDCTFTSAGTGNGLEITGTAAAFDLTDNVFTGYDTADPGTAADKAIYVNISTGTVTINVSGGSGVTLPAHVRTAGATIVVNSSVPVSVSQLTEGTPVKVIAAETVGPITVGDVLSEGFANASGVYSFSQNYTADVDVTVRARNQGVAVAVISEDGGVFTDETEEAHSNATGDLTIFPTAPVAVNDASYYGHNEQFSRIKFDVSTALDASGYTYLAEYWNGSSWATLAVTEDGTNAFSVGQGIVAWTLPGNWATTTVNGQGPLYYMRIRIAVVGTWTTSPIGSRVQLDVSRYLPYDGARTITSGGLADNASWARDNISRFSPTD